MNVELFTLQLWSVVYLQCRLCEEWKEAAQVHRVSFLRPDDTTLYGTTLCVMCEPAENVLAAAIGAQRMVRHE